MNPERWKQIDALLSAALQREEGQRAAFVAQACEGDTELQEHVQRLIWAHQAASGFLKSRPTDLSEATAGAQPAPQSGVNTAVEGRLTSPGEAGGLKPGSALGRYTLQHKLGGGGMGVVYQAVDRKLGRVVAIKLLSKQLATSEAAKARFLREARAASALDHPNIGVIYDIGEEGGELFIVMALYTGETLKQRMDRAPPSIPEIVDILRQIALGLQAAHAAGIIHRDIKPANVMVTPGGTIKILDFGLAKLVQDSAPDTLTQAGEALGTLLYMSPEQLRGQAVDVRTDWWSLGAVAYELVAGASPFRAESNADTAARILDYEAPSLASVRGPGVPGSLAELVSQLLQKDPAKRPSAREVVARLEHAAAEVSSSPGNLARPLAAVSRARIVAARHWKVVVPSAAVMVAALMVWGLLYLRQAKALTETDYILLPEFVNTTGEPVFDGTLKQALAVKLQESPFLNVVSEERIGQTLRFMGRSPDEWLTPSLAREVCQRQGVKAMVSGQISPLGSHYVIALNALNCHTGDSLARGQVEAVSKEEVLAALGKAASELRRKLGESLSSIRKFDVPIEQATTTSLEALKAFDLANRERARGTEAQAIPFLQRAIGLDPNFAVAYGRLGQVYANLGQTELGLQYTNKAFELRDRISEPEKLYIVSHYYDLVTGELEKAIETYQLWKQTYPRDWTPWANLAAEYNRIGAYDKAIGEAQEAVRLAPNNVLAYQILGWAYSGLNRFEEAKAISEQHISKGGDSMDAHAFLYSIAFIQGDSTGMERQVEWAKGKPNEEYMLEAQAGAAVFSGKLQRAREINQQAVRLSQRGNFKEHAGVMLAVEALTEAELGNPQLARERAAAALALAPRGILAKRIVGEALGLSGQADKALALADELGKRFPQNTLLNAVGVPKIRTSVELERGNAAAAIELLQSAKPYEYGEGFGSLYLRGKAHLRARAGREAAAEFQRVLDHRGLTGFWPVVYPLARLGQARAYALVGDVAQSRKTYQDFFALWKDADPDIPLLREAKAECAKLN
jgi:tetratricopeptide (TPR) repeat protein